MHSEIPVNELEPAELEDAVGSPSKHAGAVQPYAFVDLVDDVGSERSPQRIHRSTGTTRLAVELGRVVLPRERIAGFANGDLVSLGGITGDDVILIVAGNEVARGRLVTVDGMIAVNVQEVLDRKTVVPPEPAG